MVHLSTLKINSNGTVLSVASTTTSPLFNLLPKVGGNIIEAWQDQDEKKIRGYIDSIFKNPNGVEFSLIVQNHSIQCTGYNHEKEEAFICFKSIKQEVAKSIEDIADKKSVEKQLELIDHAFREVNTAIHFVNQDGTFYEFNEAMNLMLGYTKEEFKTLKIFDLNTYVTKEYWAYRWYELKEKKNTPLTTKLKKKDGSIIDVEVKTKFINHAGQELICSFFTDITEKKKAEERLNIVDFSFRNASYPILLLEEDGTLYDFNEAASELYGYTREELFGLKTGALSVSMPKKNVELWQKLKDLKQMQWESIHKKKDGTTMNVEVIANFLDYQGKELSCSFINDITEKKKVDQRLHLTDFVFRHSATPKHLIDKDGNVYDCNEAVCNLLGYTQEEYRGLKVFDISTRQTPETWAERWEYLKAVKSTADITKLRKKDNTLVDVEMRTDLFEFGNQELGFSSFIDITEKKKREGQLKLVDFAFRKSSTPILFIKEDGSIFNFNDAALALYGYTAEEMKVLKARELNAIEDDVKFKENFSNVWTTIKEQGALRYQTKHKKKDGSVMDMEISFNYIEFEGLRLNCTFSNNVTEKKKAEEASLKERKLLRTLIDNLPFSIFVKDNNARILIANLLDVAYMGLSSEADAIGKTDLEIYKDTERNKGYFEDMEVLSNGKALIDIKGLLVGKDGNKRDILVSKIPLKDEEGNVYGLVGICKDVTEAKKAEERMQLLEKVFTETSQSVVIADATEGKDTPIIYANASFTRITGYTLEEVQGQNPRFLHRGRDVRDDVGRAIMRSAIKNFTPWKVEVINYKKNGEPYWAEVSGFPVFDKSKNKYSHWVAIQTDITSRKDAEDEKEHLVNELVENNKELTQFSYITTHNLRAPLTNLMAICKKVDANNIEDELTKKLIEGFKQSTMLLNDTLNDLINILIIKENRHIAITACVFENIFQKVQSSISTILLKNVVKIDTDFSEVPTAYFSDVYMESIFLNFLINSIKYSHPTRYPLVKIKTSIDANGHTQLSYSDNGRGMNMERVKNKIFGLYQRFHSNTDGKGIGLYLTYSQVTALGGKIEVESEEGVGTTFTITFK